MQFINITDGIDLDENSRWLIRKNAARFADNYGYPTSNRAAPLPSLITKHEGTLTTMTNRFRYKTRASQDSTLKRRQPRQSDEDLPRESRSQRSRLSAPNISTSKALISEQTLSSSRKTEFQEGIIKRESSLARADPLVDFSPPILRAEARFKQLAYTRGALLTCIPGGGLWDPFSSMAVDISWREQALLHYYFNEREQKVSILMPYCHVFFRLSVHDKGCFHAVLSHYSATYRRKYPAESKEESIRHLMTAIRIVTERLQDQELRCSDGTIGTVACLIIYESANGELPNLQYHLNGLYEMVRRRGGFENGGFSSDLRRLIAWTDVNASKNLWQRPRFSDPNISVPELDAPHPLPAESNTLERTLKYSPEAKSVDITIDNILSDLQVFFSQVTNENVSHPLARQSISSCDKVATFERQLVSLIHSPHASLTSLDRACSIAALMNVGVFIGNLACVSRVIDINRLKSALEHIGDDLSIVVRDQRERKKLLWTLAFGALRSSGEEKVWFVQALAILCKALVLKAWGDMREILVEILWKEDFDKEGMNVWDAIAHIP